MSISKILYQTLCVFSQVKDRKRIEQNFHSVAKVMSRGGTAGAEGVKNLSVGICDGAHRLRTLVITCFTENSNNA